MVDVKRDFALADRLFAGNGVSLTPLPPLERVSLRAGVGSSVALGKALGTPLPANPGGTETNKGVSTLWIGPDEWIILGRQGSGIIEKLDKVKDHSFSAVAIDHRNTGMTVAGPNAEIALNGGCPRDLSLAAFPVGNCSRTILSKAEIVLWRKGREVFHLECWRSFSDYVWKYLAESSRAA